MSIKLSQAVMPLGILLMCISLIIYKVFGSTVNGANFLSGVLAGVGIVLIGSYLYVAIQTGAPLDISE